MDLTLSDMNERLRKFEAQDDLLRYLQTLLEHPNGHGLLDALQKRLGQVPAIARITRAAVDAGSTTVSGWADALVADRALTGGWMSLLSTQTLLGRIDFPRADLATRTLVEGTPAAAGWAAEGGAIPATRMILQAESLYATAIKGFVCFTQESINSTTRNALANINRGLLNTVGRFSDVALLDPEISAVVGKNPASLTNGLSSVPSTGSTEAAVTADLKNLLQVHVNAGADLTKVVIAAHPGSALHWSTLLTTGGSRAFPNVGARGGEVFGIPVLTSSGAQTQGSPSDRIVAVINPEGVLVGDNDEIEFSATDKAAIQMSDIPGAGAQPVVSMWQTGTVALRFVRPLHFRRTATNAVSFMRVAY